jgi:hypothetical protein
MSVKKKVATILMNSYYACVGCVCKVSPPEKAGGGAASLPESRIPALSGNDKRGTTMSLHTRPSYDFRSDGLSLGNQSISENPDICFVGMGNHHGREENGMARL